MSASLRERVEALQPLLYGRGDEFEAGYRAGFLSAAKEAEPIAAEGDARIAALEAERDALKARAEAAEDLLIEALDPYAGNTIINTHGMDWYQRACTIADAARHQQTGAPT